MACAFCNSICNICGPSKACCGAAYGSVCGCNGAISAQNTCGCTLTTVCSYHAGSGSHVHNGIGGAGNGGAGQILISNGAGGAGWVNSSNTARLPVSIKAPITIDNILNMLGIDIINDYISKSKCNSCDKDDVRIGMRYKIHMERNICVNCMKKGIDKLVGINLKEETEEILYGKKD